jgi:hypothetical protein
VQVRVLGCFVVPQLAQIQRLPEPSWNTSLHGAEEKYVKHA